MQHTVTIEWVVTAKRVMHWVFCVSYVNAAQICGNLANGLEFSGIVLLHIRLPWPRSVGVIIVRCQSAVLFIDEF